MADISESKIAAPDAEDGVVTIQGTGGDIIDVVTGLVGAITKLIEVIQLAAQDGAREQWRLQEQFTKEFVKTAQEYYPGLNALAVCTEHEQTFEGFVENYPQTRDVWVGPARWVRYHLYIFNSGNLAKHGDGGFINWAFMGNYEQWSDGNTQFVRFNPIERVDGGAKPIGWSEIPRSPVRSHPDGVYFVDCKRGQGAQTEFASGIAYYRNVRDGGNDGQLPDDYIDIVKGQNYPWEKASSVTFNNGTRFYWTMYDGARDAAEFSYVGNADNTYNRYRIFKDRKHLMYTNDGWECYTVYWAF